MTRLRIDLGYDGTDFHGWATQPGLRTVQGELEGAVSVLLGAPREARELREPPETGELTEPRLTVAGRTDAGVHARRQVCHLDVAPELAERVTARRLNGVLARSHSAEIPKIIVHDVTIAPDGFDARFSAVSRRYSYRVWPAGVTQDVLAARYTVAVTRPLSLNRLQAASDELLGLRDFTSFCKAREGSTAVRDLTRFEWGEAADGAYVADLEADAFCHSMVRALVGAAVGVGSERISLTELTRIRDARERTSRFTVMPAHGLTLEEVVYPPDEELAARAERTRARRDPLNEHRDASRAVIE